MTYLIRPRPAAALGFLLVLPALLFTTANVLKEELGVPFLYDALDPLLGLLDSPVLLLGGLLGALGLNTLAVAAVAAQREAEAWSVTLRVRAKPLNMAIAGVALTLLGMLLLYAFVENFAPREVA